MIRQMPPSYFFLCKGAYLGYPSTSEPFYRHDPPWSFYKENYRHFCRALKFPTVLRLFDGIYGLHPVLHSQEIKHAGLP
jgi:hypothetical protein